MLVVLVMFRADGERRSFSITRDMTIIGRREDSDLRIPLGDVSRKHCRLIKDGDVLRVEDLGSSNGTFCNGTRVTQCELNPGDTLQVGPVVFVTQIDGAPAEDELEPVVAAPAVSEGGAEGDADVMALDEVTGEPGEFDPMEALTGEDEGGSGFNFNIEDELGSGVQHVDSASINEDSDIITDDEISGPVQGADEIVDLEESEHDQKA
jgi:pSer/pThr/pTyr-binding forkhead associated (FHA) protein